MLNHSLSNSSLWNTNISFQISISSLLRGGIMTYAISCQTLRLGPTWSPLGPQDLACGGPWTGQPCGLVRCDRISLCQALELLLETGYRYLGWVFKYTAPIIALPWTCRFYRSSAVPLINLPPLTGDSETPRASDKQWPTETCLCIQVYQSLCLWPSPLHHVYTTLDPENFPRGLWPPWHSSHGMMPLATLFPNSNLPVWMLLKLLKFWCWVGREDRRFDPETTLSYLP